MGLDLAFRVVFRLAPRTDDLLPTLDLDATDRCRSLRGSSRVAGGRPAGSCFTSSRRPRNMPVTPTSSANRWTAPRRWAEPAVRRHG